MHPTSCHNSRRGGIISGLLSIFGVLILIAVAGGFYLARNVSVQATHRDNGESVQISVPGGRLNVQADDRVSPAALGAPLYPGAQRKPDSTGGASVRWTSNDGDDDKGVGVAGGEFVTEDSPGRVLAWYREQLPSWVMVEEKGSVVHFELKKGAQKRLVSIHGKSDGTHIAIIAIGEPASN